MYKDLMQYPEELIEIQTWREVVRKERWGWGLLEGRGELKDEER